MAEKRERGFAAMKPELQREIASKGGRAAHQRGTAHEWDSTEAAAAGRKGGRASHRLQNSPNPGSTTLPPTTQSQQADQSSEEDSNTLISSRISQI